MNADLQQALNYANQDVQARGNISPLRSEYARFWFATQAEQLDASRFINDVATMLSTQQRITADQALQQAVQIVMPIMVANFAVKFGLANQMAYTEQSQINELINKGKQLAMTVAQMYQAPQAQQAYVPPQQLQQQAYGGQGNWQQQQHLGITFNPVQTVADAKVHLAGAAIVPVADTTYNSAPVANYMPGSRVMPIVDDQTQPVAPAPVYAPVALASDLVPPKFEVTLATPYNVVYYPRDQRLAYRMDQDDNVIEYLEDLTMDYEALETRKFQSNVFVEDGKVAETMWGILATNQVEDVQPSGDVAVKEIRYMGDIGDIFHGYNSAMLKFRTKNMGVNDLCWEFIYNKPYLVDTLSNQVGFMTTALKSGDPADLAAALLNQFTTSTEVEDGVTRWVAADGFGMPGYVALDRYITRLVNDALKKHLGDLGYSIDSFVSDWLDLIKAYAANYGTGFTDRVLPKLNRYIVNRLKPVKGEQLKAYIAESGEKDFSKYCLLLDAHYHCTTLNVMSEELNIEWDGPIGIVCQNNVPQFHAALVGIVKRALQRNDVTTVYISTLDKRIIEVTNAWLADDSFLLTIVE